MSSASEPSSSRPAKLQFSLRGLMFFAAICACAASYWFAMRQTKEMEGLKAENERIRNQFGDLTIEPGAEDNAHVIAVPNINVGRQFNWQWRVYVPQGAKVYAVTDERPKGGRPDSPESFVNPFESGLVSVELRHDPAKGWSWIVATPHVFTDIPVSRAARDAKDFRTSVAGHAGAGQTVVVKPGVALQLVRIDAVPIDQAGTENTADRIVIALWIFQKLPANAVPKK